MDRNEYLWDYDRYGQVSLIRHNYRGFVDFTVETRGPIKPVWMSLIIKSDTVDVDI